MPKIFSVRIGTLLFAGSGALLLLLTLKEIDRGATSPSIAQPKPVAAPKGIASTTNPIIAAAGDIACDLDSSGTRPLPTTDKTCHMMATSNLLVGQPWAAVLGLGDLQYEDGTLAKFKASYQLSWGRFKALTRPVVGNHEYLTPGAAGYFDYFGAAAGDRNQGYYSFNLGQWHLIALNANCEYVGGCQASSAQGRWLKADLAAHPKMCILAYWHQPRFSSGLHGNNPSVAPFWETLYAAKADIVLNGHDHVYERFAPQTPSAQPDARQGIREFVVGNGGKNLYPFVNLQPNSQVRNNDTFGILKLVLHPHGYEWQFLPESGKSFTDQGSGQCHNR
jgi:hypothetical protein